MQCVWCYHAGCNKNMTRPSMTHDIWLVLDLPTPEGWKAELT